MAFTFAKKRKGEERMRMKTLKKGFAAIALSVAMILSLGQPVSAKTEGNGTVIYTPDNGGTFDPGGATYARIICLKNSGSANGTLLCTYDQLKNVSVTMKDGKRVSKQVYPIYQSKDGGDTWTHLADVYDREYNLSKTSQPCLFELPRQIGDMPKGTIILAGNIFDDAPKTQSRIVLYKSLDGGKTWSFLAQVDNGGPCVYDPGVNSTTTTVWEPFLGVDKYGDLVCYYSDERQKKDGVLQAVSFKTSKDGKNWGNFGNVAAITNRTDRPGMITVTSLPNGKYMATYEMVNRPSLKVNNAVVYCKFSDDGITWNANSLGTRVALADGRGIGSSPYVKWVNAGGPNGMVIVSAKWGTDAKDNLSGGQNFYVNYNLGQGAWERLPMAVTYDPIDTEGGYFSGFSQSFDVSPDNKTLYQATNVENFANKKVMDGKTYNLNDVRVGSIPLNGTIYEAEKATLNKVKVENAVDATNGQEVRYINEVDSTVTFNNVKVEAAGNYKVLVRYSNGENKTASHMMNVNGSAISNTYYAPTANWDRYLWTSFTCNLKAGNNTITFKKGTGFAELDCIMVCDDATGFGIVNANSKKYLEVKNANTAANAELSQWGITSHMCQNWKFEAAGNGYYRIKNKNSGLYLDIAGQSKADGAKAIQAVKSNADSQLWQIKDAGDGSSYIINKNSGKYLEVVSNSSEDGAAVGQWGPTGYGCQKWILKREGIM